MPTELNYRPTLYVGVDNSSRFPLRARTDRLMNKHTVTDATDHPGAGGVGNEQ